MQSEERIIEDVVSRWQPFLIRRTAMFLCGIQCLCPAEACFWRASPVKPLDTVFLRYDKDFFILNFSFCTLHCVVYSAFTMLYGIYAETAQKKSQFFLRTGLFFGLWKDPLKSREGWRFFVGHGFSETVVWPAEVCVCGCFSAERLRLIHLSRITWCGSKRR